jgi:polar amino acid transport system substrate-binding protein
VISGWSVHSARAEMFNVGYYSDGFPPFFFDENDQRKGIYVEILEAISAITGDQFIKKYATVARIKAQFGEDYYIEPGINPIWRPGQEEISVYTIPFFQYQDVVVMRKKTAFPVSKAEDLHGQAVGIIRGYSYPNWEPEQGNYLPDLAKDETQLFTKFKAGRFDILIAGALIAAYYAKELGLDIEIVHVLYSTELSFRLHVSKKSAVKRIDNALKTLLQDGTIDAINQKYLE